jgi:hypothetical protein
MCTHAAAEAKDELCKREGEKKAKNKRQETYKNDEGKRRKRGE